MATIRYHLLKTTQHMIIVHVALKRKEYVVFVGGRFSSKS